MAWEENSCICLHMQLIAILSRIGVYICSNNFVNHNFLSCLVLSYKKELIYNKARGIILNLSDLCDYEVDLKQVGDYSYYLLIY